MGSFSRFSSQGIRVASNRLTFIEPCRFKYPGTPPALTLDKSLVCEDQFNIQGDLTITSPGALAQLLSATGLPVFAQTVLITNIAAPTLWAFYPQVTGFINDISSVVHLADAGAGVGDIRLAGWENGVLRLAEEGITIAAAPGAAEIDTYDILSNVSSNPIMYDLSIASYGKPCYLYAYQIGATASRQVTVTVEIEAT